VALTRAWPETEAVVFTLLAAGTLLVVLFMDMLPPAVLGRARRPAEGVGAVIFVGLLMGLTGGTDSPFFVGFFLVWLVLRSLSKAFAAHRLARGRYPRVRGRWPAGGRWCREPRLD
jgi:hypothetical protein